MSGLAEGARRAGTGSARLPPLMSSLLSIVLFHPCFPRAIQPEQTILFSPSDFSIILLNLQLGRAQAWVYSGLLFQLAQGARGQYWPRIILCESSLIVFLWEREKNKTLMGIWNLHINDGASFSRCCFTESRCFSCLMGSNLLLINPLNPRSYVLCQICCSKFLN